MENDVVAALKTPFETHFSEETSGKCSVKWVFLVDSRIEL